MTKARSLVDVVLGEAAYGSPSKRYADMKAIASVIANRAKSLGVTPEQVISNRREFNAYGKSLPKGASSYRSMAQKAIDDVVRNGPVHNATFYATPRAAGNLPKGLKQEAATSGHVYYSDPQNRAIGTSLGFRQPRPVETASQAIDSIMAQPATIDERMGIQPAAYTEPQQEATQNMAQVPTRTVRTTSYFRPEPQASLDSLRPGLLAEQYAAYGAGKVAPNPSMKTDRLPMDPSVAAGLLSQDVAQQRMIDQLNAQKRQLAAGINPMGELSPETAWGTPSAVVPGPIDQPMGDVPVADIPQVQVQQVDPVATSAVGAQIPAGLLTQEQMRAGAKMEKDLSNRKTAGKIIGGLLGAVALGGPIGGLLGGVIGNSVAKRSYYPDAPTPPSGSSGNTNRGYSGLSEEGRSIYNSSMQVRDAVDKGRVGLY